MILSAKVQITHKNKKLLNNLNYIGNIGDIIDIEIHHAINFYMSIYISVCENCGNKFETKNSKKRFCCRKCSATKQWLDNDFRNNIKDIYDSKEFRYERSKRGKESWLNNTERKNSVSEKLKKLWTDEEKKKRKEEMLERWSDVSYREKMTNLSTIAQNRPEMIEANRKRGIEMWKNPEHAKKVFNNQFKYKKYTMPSGKIVKIQGYEPKALDILINKYEENDIVVGVEEMNKNIGKILYVDIDGLEHTYYPDIYIKSINTIIEVKSTYTYDLHKETNELKKQAILDKGMNFEFMIFS